MNQGLFSSVHLFVKLSLRHGYYSLAKCTAVFSLQGEWKLIIILVAKNIHCTLVIAGMSLRLLNLFAPPVYIGSYKWQDNLI